MFAFLLPLLGNWKLILAGLAAAALAWFVYDWEHKNAELAQDQIKLSVLQANLDTANKLITINEQAAQIAANKAAQEAKDNAQLQTLVEETHRAQPKDNAVVAPVLGSALDGISKLRNTNNSSKKPTHSS